MKVRLGDLKPNPFRNYDDYPLNKTTVDLLVQSITKTCFWDNILVRRNKTELNPKGEFQLAYGHHRMTAATQVLGVDHIVDIPVKDLSDDDMLRIQGEENLEIYVSKGPTNIRARNAQIKQVWLRLKKLYNLNYITSETTKTSQGSGGGPKQLHFEGLPVPISGGDGFHHSCIAKQMQEWMGETWNEKSINQALTQLRRSGEIKWVRPKKDKTGNVVKDKDDKILVEFFSEPVTLSKTAVERMPDQQSSDLFQQVMYEQGEEGETPVPKDVQDRVAEKIMDQVTSGIESKAITKEDIEAEVVKEIKGEEAGRELEFISLKKKIRDLETATESLSKKYKKFNSWKKARKSDTELYNLFLSTFEEFKFKMAITGLALEITRFCGKEQSTHTVEIKKLTQ